MEIELHNPCAASTVQGVLPIRLERSRDFPVLQSGSRLSLLDWSRVILIAVVLPNLITCAKFTAFAGFFRGWINIEFIIIAALYGFTRRRVVLLFIPLELLLDLFEPVARVYYFNPHDAFDALRYVGMVPVWNLALYTSLVAAYIALLMTAVRFIPSRANRSMATVTTTLLIAASLLLGFDYVSGRYQAFGSDIRIVRADLVRTPVLSAAFRAFSLTRPHRVIPPGAVGSASMQLLSGSQPSLIASRTNFVLVLVESWGRMNNARAADSLELVYKTAEMGARYTVEKGSVAFSGATVHGEARELCGEVFPNGIAEANANDLRGCLPNVFATHGYSTVGIHGFHERMYDRRNWYPRVGFATTLFEEDLDRLGMKTCAGGLVGNCDVDVAQVVANKLMESSASHPLFLHWVTLNSHLPVSDDISKSEDEYCEALSPAFQDNVLCNWHALVERVHQSVARIALTKSLPPTAFVIVGDHAPPFSSSKRRAEFSQTEVPYVVLIPKNSGVDANMAPERQAGAASHPHSAPAS
jgi:hypothetical protein